MNEQGGVWLRGNLHLHTNRSDGKKSYEEAIDLYERAGYDFLAVTDHWVLSQEGTTEGGMLLFSGCEYNVGAKPRDGIYHIVGVGMQKDPGLDREDPELSAQRMIDAVNQAGGISILAHPAWSLNSADEVARLHGLCGAEIYNTTSGFPLNVRPYAGLFIDQLASRGVLLPCMAADDAHQYTHDVLGGYLMVYAREKTHKAVMQALREGSYYATQGPQIDVRYEKERIVVSCSPAAHIVFYSDDVFNPERVFSGEAITQAVYHISWQDTYVRIEVIDEDGKRAYTSPVRVNE